MLRKYASFAAASLLVGAGMATACSPLPQAREDCWMNAVDVRPLDRKQVGEMTHFFHSDTLKGQLVFAVSTYCEVQDRESPARTSTSVAVASDELPPMNLRNSTRFGESSLKFDKPIRVNGETIAAGVNLLDLERREDYLLFPEAIEPFVIHQVHLRPEFFDIPKGDYTLSFEWKTDDGRVLSDTVSVEIAIGKN
ncbi:MAG: hypothetical protein SVX43_20285 [Cyanobacteriota bacterium]|nr:hypothetical protein [Cyanobacteriota bacterium]